MTDSDTPESTAPKAPASEPSLEQTALHLLHLDHDARMGPFAGYELPMRYADGPVAEHQHTRNAASLFDVSHMGIVELHGDGAAAALEKLVPAAIQTLAEGRARYTCLTNDRGGIIDDLIVTNHGHHLGLVVNGARKAVDLAHLRAHLDSAIEVVHRDDKSLMALQGPQAADVIAGFAPEAIELTFMRSTSATINGIAVDISRSGYTGEDGFELSVANDNAVELATSLLAHDSVEFAGLAARDTLRLEAGLCLYGQDLTEDITPVEADLVWSIQKARREGGDYLGASVIAAQIAHGPTRSRVGIEPSGKRPIRDGATLRGPDTDAESASVGLVTSGGFGPTVDRPIAMGYVPTELATIGQELIANNRGRDESCRVAELPFTAHNYYRGTA